MDGTSASTHPELRIAVIGAGGLGCAVLPRAARMEPALLTIIDGDRIEASNLQRQPLYETMDIGQAKATTAALWMRQLVIGGEVRAHDIFVDAGNAIELLRGHHIVVEGVDDLHAKTLIDRTCAELSIPLVSGGVHGRFGQVLVLHAPGRNTDLSRGSVFTGKPGAQQDGCDMRHVPLALLEEVGRVMMARVHDLANVRTATNGRIEVYDHQARTWMSIDPPKA